MTAEEPRSHCWMARNLRWQARSAGQNSQCYSEADNGIAIVEDGETHLNADCHTANRSTLVPNTYRDHGREASYKVGTIKERRDLFFETAAALQLYKSPSTRERLTKNGESTLVASGRKSSCWTDLPNSLRRPTSMGSARGACCQRTANKRCPNQGSSLELRAEIVPWCILISSF
ncbi:hypothetical protein GA0061100_1212 [Rhizobium hainanense]|uniref:Uncharacterized protein n=1 Tax=Rhizobium hainanense TaxID=52131 RepID=A0A1C3WJ20_9HYPH|nr:hypothetical protein GA0061100_1212 [Rhizobium hainanense]